MKATNKKFRVLIEKTNTGFCAKADDYPVYTTGGTILELIDNMVEAFNLYYEDDGIELRPSNIELYMALDQFFKDYPAINSNFLAQRIGMNPTLLSQYVRGHKKPSAKQAQRILGGIHQIGAELSDIHLLNTR